MHIVQPQSACFRQMLGSKKYQERLKCILTLTLPIFFPENFVCFFMSAAKILEHFRLDFIMEGNTMNPDQIAPFDQGL